MNPADTRISTPSGFALLCLFVILSNLLMAQDPDEPGREEINESRIEKISSQTDNETDYTDLLQGMDDFLKHPLNLNHATFEELSALSPLNEMQINNLLEHIQKNGKLLSIFELQTIEGWDLELIKTLLPYIRVSDEEPVRFNFRDALDYGTHDVFLRYQRTLEPQTGYLPVSDSVLRDRPDSRYCGSPDKFFIRYRYKFYQKISLGLTAEKDPGEQFFAGAQKCGFDFYSAHLMVRNLGIVKSAVIGDYYVQFGQGLTLWSGMGFGKSSDVVNIKKIATLIKPYSSTDENRFMRGGAISLGWKGWGFTAFYSCKHIDANCTAKDSATGKPLTVSGFQESGLHSIPSEIADRKTLGQQIFGGHLECRKQRLNAGFTAVQTWFDAAVTPDPKLYNQFDFSGNSSFNTGCDLSYVFRNVNAFAEVSRSGNGAMAWLCGLMMSMDSRVSFSALYRNYPRNYQALYSSAFSEGGANANEEGLFLGLALKFNARWNLSVYGDFFSFRWLRFNLNAPSAGQDFMTQLSWKPNKKTELSFRVHIENKEQNSDNEQQVIDYTVGCQKQSFRLHLSTQISPSFLLKSRVEYQVSRKGSGKAETGYLFYQDLRYKPLKLPVSFSLRYALFHTDSYDSRMYAYENDVLYSYSVPAYFYKGIRFCFMIRIRLHRHADFWIRYALTAYSNKENVSSGLNEIHEPHKSEIKAQLRLKF